MSDRRAIILNSLGIILLTVLLLFTARELGITRLRVKALENDMTHRFAYEGDFVRYACDTDNFLESKLGKKPEPSPFDRWPKYQDIHDARRARGKE